MRRLGIRTLRGPRSAASTCSRPTTRSTTGRRAASTSRTCSTMPDVPDGHAAAARCARRTRRCRGALDWTLIEAAKDAIDHRTPVTGEFAIRNVNRTRRRPALERGHRGARRRRACRRRRSATRCAARPGSRSARWLAPGVELTLIGDANDYTGKGLSGGVLAVRPPEDADVRGRGERDHRQHRALRRDRRPRVLPRARGRALRGAQLGRRAPSSRASATTAAST